MNLILKCVSNIGKKLACIINNELTRWEMYGERGASFFMQDKPCYAAYGGVSLIYHEMVSNPGLIPNVCLSD